MPHVAASPNGGVQSFNQATHVICENTVSIERVGASAVSATLQFEIEGRLGFGNPRFRKRTFASS
jgi:hypothetical protein